MHSVPGLKIAEVMHWSGKIRVPYGFVEYDLRRAQFGLGPGEESLGVVAKVAIHGLVAEERITIGQLVIRHLKEHLALIRPMKIELHHLARQD